MADDEIMGPAKLPCEQRCDVPEGVTLVFVPPPRHNWPDVLVCPNEGCGRAWLVVKRDD
jgi:hypothetical protein